MYRHGAGFSGVLFHLLVLECSIASAPASQSSSRSIFGFVSVPAYLYPWVLLVVLQVILPNLSFMGHLSGILAGTLQMYGVLDVFAIPSNEYLQGLEERRRMSNLASKLPNFVPTPATDLLRSQYRDVGSLGQSVCGGIRTAAMFVLHVFETIRVVVFGRGRRANDNVQLLGGWSAAPGGGGGTSRFEVGSGESNDDDDDHWNGLPEPSPPQGQQRRPAPEIAMV